MNIKNDLGSILDHIQSRTPVIAYNNAIAALESLLSDKPDPAKLSLMPGWGGLVKWLVPSNELSDLDKDRSSNLRGLLEQNGLSLKEVAWLTTNAFDTSPHIARRLCDKLVSMGIGKSKTKILFPACGTGIFALTFQHYHPDVYAKLEITAIDIDPIRCKIFSILNPNAVVICRPFEEWAPTIADDRFHVTMDNVPFSDVKVDDRPLHCYFLKQMTRLTVSGGAIVYLTSTGFLDSAGNLLFRQKQAQESDLVYLFPIPQNAHQGTGTAVDTLVFIKR